MAWKICWRAFLVVPVMVLGVNARAIESGVTKAEYDKLRKEVEELKTKLSEATPLGGAADAASKAMENKYGPNAPVTTKQGKLTMGGLLQVWYYSIQNDNRGWVDADQQNGGAGSQYGSNEVLDNDSFRIRRAQLRFTMDIHENVTAYIMIDPAAEASSFPTFPSNQGLTDVGVAYTNAGIDVTDPDNPVAIGNIRNDAVRNGSGSANRLLHDAYINFHGLLPHHDVTVGQFQRKLGEEGVRDDRALDFVERSMITQLAVPRDLGVQLHGYWWNERFQYWLGGFNGAGTAFQNRANRSDDNDDKDIVASALIRPVWMDEDSPWGKLELGYSIMYGNGGEGGSRLAGTAPVDGLNRADTVHMLQYAYAMYKPGGPVKGWWLRGEWGHYRDRFAPNEVVSGPTLAVATNPKGFSIQGWNFSTGYKLSDSIWGEDLRNGGTFTKAIEPMEFVFRYDVMANLFHQDLPQAENDIDVFKTQVFTGGINYYIKGHNAKIQVNYNWVLEEGDKDNPNAGNGDTREIREVSNHNLVVNFQVAW